MFKPENRNPDGEFLTLRQAAQQFNLGITLTRSLAEKYNAIVRPTRRCTRIDRQRFAEGLRGECR